MATRYFTAALFTFLRELRDNNNREWFTENKHRYEKAVREPALRFISDFGPRLAKIAPHLAADPRPVGGSLFRIHRDTRFSRDKSPYKTHLGIHFFHERAKKAPSVPGFYLHLAPEQCFAAAGIWHPDPVALSRVREAIASGSAEWKTLRRSKLPLEGGSLKRAPKGYSPDHPFVDDLKRTDFVTSMMLSERQICSPQFMAHFERVCRKMSLLVKFVTRALDLPW